MALRRKPRHIGGMTKRTFINSHTSSNRDSWWWLEQDADGTLHVVHENQDDASTNWRRPINEAMKSGGTGFGKSLQALIDRMFKADDA